jgi:hypothetical protein
MAGLGMKPDWIGLIGKTLADAEYRAGRGRAVERDI